MFCGRRVSVLVSTLALVAGCGSTDRVEVTGTVTDLRTGRALAHARVTGANGVATHTNDEGHFTITVVRGVRTQLRVSADGHLDAVQGLAMDAPQTDVPLAFQLQPNEEVSEVDSDPSANAVVRWATAPWLRRRFGHAESFDAGRLDGGVQDSGLSRVHVCPYPTSHASPDTHENAIDSDAVYPWLGDGAVCVSCHQHRATDSQVGQPQADVIAGSLEDIAVAAPHAYLADACLACHQETYQPPRPSHGEHRRDEFLEPEDPVGRGRDAWGACARCHGETEVDLVFEDEATGLPATYEQVVARARAAMAARLDAHARSRTATLIEWLEADGSHGVHNPALVQELLQVAAH